MAFLLAGGYEDPNLAVLAEAAQRTKIDFLDLRLPVSHSPAFCWKLEEGAPLFSGREIKATGAFIRHDVFGGMKDPRPEVASRAFAWYQTVMALLLSQPRIRIFNRQMSPAASNKPATLVLAREAGLQQPIAAIEEIGGEILIGGHDRMGVALLHRRLDAIESRLVDMASVENAGPLRCRVRWQRQH